MYLKSNKCEKCNCLNECEVNHLIPNCFSNYDSDDIDCLSHCQCRFYCAKNSIHIKVYKNECYDKIKKHKFIIKLDVQYQY